MSIMKRVIKYDEIMIICKALANLAGAYALQGNKKECRILISLSDKLCDIAGMPEDYIKIEFK